MPESSHAGQGTLLEFDTTNHPTAANQRPVLDALELS
jgi:hypothetical protein